MLADDRKIRHLIEAEAGYPKELEQPYEGQSIRWHRSPADEVGINAVHLGLPLLRGDRPRETGPSDFSPRSRAARCEPRHAVMIGDRLYNDIRPARLLGWKTIRILRGFARFQEPRDRLDEADATIADLAELLSLFPTAIGARDRGGAAARHRSSRYRA